MVAFSPLKVHTIFFPIKKCKDKEDSRIIPYTQVSTKKWRGGGIQVQLTHLKKHKPGAGVVA